MHAPVVPQDQDKIALLAGFQAYWVGQRLCHEPIDGDDVSFGPWRAAEVEHQFAGSAIDFRLMAQAQDGRRAYSCGDDAAHGLIGHVIRTDLEGGVEWIVTMDADGPFERIWIYDGGVWAQSPSLILRIDDGEAVRIRIFRT